MADIDLDWVKDQMTRARVTQNSGTSVLRLLDLWNTMNHTDKSAKETIEVFSKLALGYAIAEETPPIDGHWIEAQPGQLKVAEIVRVKSDAFTGPQGERHNGRICRIVAIRYGDIICKSIDDRDPVLEGTHYSPHDLEKLIPA